MLRKFTMEAGSEKLLGRLVNRLQKHATKMGYGACAILSVGKVYERRRHVITKCDGEVAESSYAVSVCDVVLELPPQFANPASAEWNVIGRVERVDSEAEVVSETHFAELVELVKTFGWLCDHCGHKLSNAFAVRNAAGVTKLVGIECVRHFTGADAAAILKLTEFMAAVEVNWDESEGGGGGGKRGLMVVDLTAFLAQCLAVARKRGGYLRRWEQDGYGEKTENMYCTRNHALVHFEGRLDTTPRAAGVRYIHTPTSIGYEYLPPTNADKEEAAKLVADWAAYQADPANEYTVACVALADRGWCTSRSAGIAASLIKGLPVPPVDYSVSKHVGTLNKRETFTNLTVIGVTVRDGDFGQSTILRFTDKDNNLLTWFASGVVPLDKGTVVTVRATVKHHDTFRGNNVTIINRAKMV